MSERLDQGCNFLQWMNFYSALQSTWSNISDGVNIDRLLKQRKLQDAFR